MPNDHPTLPGFYWYRDIDPGDGTAYEWEIAQVLNERVGPGIIIDGITKQPEEVTGEWGTRIPDPEEDRDTFEVAEPGERIDIARPNEELRDTFAAFALTGFLAGVQKGDPSHDCQTAAQIAYNYADAMIEEREKRNA